VVVIATLGGQVLERRVGGVEQRAGVLMPALPDGKLGQRKDRPHAFARRWTCARRQLQMLPSGREVPSSGLELPCRTVEAEGGRCVILQHPAEQALGVLPAAGVEQVNGHVGGQEAPHGALDAEAARSLITLGGDFPALLKSAHAAQHAAEVEAGPGDGLGVADLLGDPTRFSEVADSRS
jgi:hypothetical protein